MASNYTRFETDTLAFEAKSQIRELMRNHGAVPVILYALSRWTDRVRLMTRGAVVGDRLQESANCIERAVREYREAIDAD
jgi:hypothetical protein